MPLYVWVDKLSGREFEVLRSTFAEFQDPPRDEDLPEAERGKPREWEKRVGKGIRVTRGDSWGPGKGNWGK